MSTTELGNKKIVILGLGREGLSTLKFLKKRGIKCDVLDAKKNKNYADKIADYEVVFRTPGFPRLHPKLLAAEKNGVVVSSHIKLFFDLCPAKIIGITGTKGKTTTASLIYQILKSKYQNVFLAGNIGKPALDILPKLNNKSLVVLELSSFQTQDLHKSPHIAVITNMTLDHMDPSGKFGPATHQTAKEYFDAKLNILKHQKPGDFAIIHPSLKNITKNIGQGRKIYFDTPKYQRVLSGLNEIKLRGKHNFENITLAIEVGKVFKVPMKNIFKAVENFKGVGHRLEFVRKINGVSFYNDSAATNPEATLAALKSFKEPLHLILGGSDKGLDYKNLVKYIAKSRNIKTVALIGQIKNKLYKTLRYLIYDRDINSIFKIHKVKTLKQAVLTCFKNSGKNEIVLLSPAAASLDMFENYAERGARFKKIVQNIRRRNARDR